MILLEITNSSDLVASKVGKFIELLTPEQIDQNAVEEKIVEKMVENLSLEGVKGEISLVSGVQVHNKKLIVNEGIKISTKTKF